MATAGVNRKQSKGRQVIKIEYIPDKEKRQVTFTKRKGGIFKKASELILLCDADVAVIIFSEAGKPYAMGNPSVDDVLSRFANLTCDDDEDDDAPALIEGVPGRGAVEAIERQVEEAKALVNAEKLRLRDVGEKVMQAAAAAGKKFWWEVDVEALGKEELPVFDEALKRLRNNVRQHVKNTLAKAKQ